MIQRTIAQWLTRRPTDRALSNVPAGNPFVVVTTDSGLKRGDNQDRAVFGRFAFPNAMAPGFSCAVICDGMGGMPDGEESAIYATAAFFQALSDLSFLAPQRRLEQAALRGNEAVFIRNRGGGATISAVLIEDRRAYTLNIGDSRIYGLAKRSGGITRLTVDDTLNEAYGGTGNGLLQYLGIGAGIQPHVKKIESDYECLAITTDGAHRIGDEWMLQLFIHSQSNAIFARRVLETARWTGGYDNASIIVVERDLNTDFYEMPFDGPTLILWTSESEIQLPLTRQRPSDSTTEQIPSSVQPARKPPAKRKSKRSSPKAAPPDKAEQIDIGFVDLNAPPTKD